MSLYSISCLPRQHACCIYISVTKKLGVNLKLLLIVNFISMKSSFSRYRQLTAIFWANKFENKGNIEFITWIVISNHKLVSYQQFYICVCVYISIWSVWNELDLIFKNDSDIVIVKLLCVSSFEHYCQLIIASGTWREEFSDQS